MSESISPVVDGFRAAPSLRLKTVDHDAVTVSDGISEYARKQSNRDRRAHVSENLPVVRTGNTKRSVVVALEPTAGRRAQDG
jgi:hypothetical protein